ncbi:MAG: AbrB/MazE/SpoVT family DNA-binding domain-containing protein [Kiritimatiellae bacterium]|nr:AbrB/MazE/SpoVT family DNA-binding domain-containing protein [Kiritimatiellia bacterium]
MIAELSKVGKRGTLVIPAGLRRRFNMMAGSVLMAEETPEGILLRPAAVLPIEAYTRERKAEFLLSNAVDAADHAGAARAVKAMGLDSTKIKHRKPAGA